MGYLLAGVSVPKPSSPLPVIVLSLGFLMHGSLPMFPCLYKVSYLFFCSHLLAGVSASGRFPVIVLSPGFLVHSSAYDSYLLSAVTSGCAAVTYDTQQSALEPLDDIDITQVCDTAWHYALSTV